MKEISIRLKQIRWEKKQRKLLEHKIARLPRHTATDTPHTAICSITLSTDIHDYDTSGMTEQQREVAIVLYATGYYKGRPRYEPNAHYMRHNLLTNTVSVCGKEVIVLKDSFGFKFYYE